VLDRGVVGRAERATTAAGGRGELNARARTVTFRSRPATEDARRDLPTGVVESTFEGADDRVATSGGRCEPVIGGTTPACVQHLLTTLRIFVGKRYEWADRSD
jgi:hypothetical protein